MSGTSIIAQIFVSLKRHSKILREWINIGTYRILLTFCFIFYLFYFLHDFFSSADFVEKTII